MRWNVYLEIWATDLTDTGFRQIVDVLEMLRKEKQLSNYEIKLQGDIENE